MLEMILSKARLLPNCERTNSFYLQIGDRRFIFDGGKYAGWYKP